MKRSTTGKTKKNKSPPEILAECPPSPPLVKKKTRN